MAIELTIDTLQRRLAEAETALREKGEMEARLQAALEALRQSETRLAADLAGLRRLYELNARQANEPDLRARLEQIIEAANSFLGTDRGCIQLVSDDGARLEMFAYRGYEPASPFIRHFLHEGSKPTCDAARVHQQRLVIEDVATFPGLAGTADREVELAEQILATQSTPMVTRGGEMVGVLSNQFRAPHRPTERELRLIDLLAWNAAEIVERHHAEAALRVSERDLREKEVWFAAQNEAFGAAMNGSPLETSLGILARAVENGAEDGRRCAFYIADERGSRLRHVVGMGDAYARAVDGFEISPESLACGLAVAQGKRVITPDVLEDQRWRPWCWLAREYGYRGCWSFPVETSAGTLVGLFAVYFSGPRDACPRDLQLAATMTQTAAIIISRHRENEERVRSEERLRQFGELSQDVLWIRDAETLQWIYLTPAFETIYGMRRNDALFVDNFRSWLDLIVPGDREKAGAAIGRVKAGEYVSFDYQIKRPCDGAIRWLRNTDFPIRNEAGEVALIGGIGHDLTEFRQTELRFRALTEGIPQLVWRAIGGGERTWSGLQWTDFTGQTEPDSHGWGWLEVIHADDRDAARDAWSHATETGGFELECRIFHRQELGHRWFKTRATPVRDEAGAIIEWLGTSTDIHDLRKLQAHQNVLVAELQHRTRNLMAVVQSMAEKTARASADLGDFLDRFRDRLDALARVQDLLSRLDEHDRVTFDELIRSELAAVDGNFDKGVTLRGPSGVRLRSSTVQTLAMAMHELATNAVKYGALGQPAGRLAVTWSLKPSESDGKPWLQIEWRESGIEIPAASEIPSRTGHGRELIERALPYELSARTSYKLGRDGVHCLIAIPVSASTAEVGRPD